MGKWLLVIEGQTLKQNGPAPASDAEIVLRDFVAGLAHVDQVCLEAKLTVYDDEGGSRSLGITYPRPAAKPLEDFTALERDIHRELLDRARPGSEAPPQIRCDGESGEAS
jgi:hypothetical protein